MLNKKLMTMAVLTTMMLKVSAQQDVGEASGVTEPGLIGHWTFDEGKGAMARDASGRGNHGKVMGGASWTKGVFGGALAFDGTDDFVLLPNEGHFDLTGNMTVSAWIRVDAFTRSWQSIVTKGDRAWRLHRASNTNCLGWACSDLSRGEVGDLYGERAVNDGRWHHVAGILDGTRSCLFVDGVLDASERTTRAISTNDFPVLIGENAQQKGRLFRGCIDDVRIYNRALSVDELQALFKEGAAAAQLPASKAVVTRPDAGQPIEAANVVNLVRGEGHWPEFRGPAGNGCAESKALPLTWNETDSITWKTAIHDIGWSSPVVWGNQVWVTTATKNGKQAFAVCVDRRTGKVVHDIKVFDVAKAQFVNAVNSHASPTPAIEAGRVYVHYGAYGTACLDTNTGKTIWERRDLECEHHMGPGASPILFNNLLVFNVDGTDQQYVIALDKATGKTVWKTPRSVDYTNVHKFCRKSFCTPGIFRVNGKLQLISPGSKGIFAYDALTGEERWKARHSGWSIVPRPLAGHGLVFVVTDYDHPQLWALHPGGRGDVTDTHVAWKVRNHVSSMPSLLLVDGLLYMVTNNGTVSCIDAKTGEVAWKESRIGGNYYASPIHAAGRIYLFNRRAETTVIEAGRRFKVLAKNALGKAILQATPAVAGNALFLRTETHLYRIADAAKVQ